MKKIFILLSLATIFSCEQTVDPYDLPFSCLLDIQIQGNVTSTFTYDEKGVMLSRLRRDLTNNTNDVRVFTYDTSGKLTQITSTVTGSSSYIYNMKFAYGTDGKVSQITENYGGSTTAVYNYTRTGNVLRVDYIPAGFSAPKTTDDYTFAGDNITTDLYKEYYGTGNSLSYTETIEYSGFDAGINPSYTYFSKVNGIPFPASRNNPATGKLTYFSTVNGAAQPATVINYSYKYTYNKSMAVLTTTYTYGSNNTAGTTTTNTYQDCE